MKRKLFLVLAVIVIAGTMALSAFLLLRSQKNSDSRFCLGTYCTITVYGNAGKAKKAISDAWDAVTELENRISATLPYSEVSRVNSAAGSGTAVEVSKDTFELAMFASEMGKTTGGALDCALGSLISLWGIGTEEARIPARSEIDALLGACTMDNVLIFEKDGKYYIETTDPGTHIHFGAVGKGWAADLAAKVLKDRGIRSASINFGGNILLVGKCPTLFGSRPFLVGLQDPSGQQGEIFRTLEVQDVSVVTSGSYERSIAGEDGHVYSHILDPSTGSGVENSVLSVSVAGPSSAVCDALSTAFFVMGVQKAGDLLEKRFPEYGAVFLVPAEDSSAGPSVVTVGNSGVLE
ncbi:MAG: FAD:protein FMN transferase [Spirochaetales bacterium]|nr:FAD:protein FMN transferase [Spirochaetales bacterium]